MTAFNDISAPTPTILASPELASQVLIPGTYSTTLITSTLGTNSTFVGYDYALTTITVESGVIIQGQLLARTGAVNLNAISAALVIAGVAIGGYATLQIREMNVNSGGQVLPELTHFPTHMPATAVYASIKIKRGDYPGNITIPALQATLPIYEGTEDTQLKKGVGHFEGSVLPGLPDNSVLAGHRDSVFSKLGKLQIGDLLIVNTSAGKFTYKISGFKIVNADDRTVIVPTKTAILTLSTCYPFRFFGNAPKRYIVSANLLPESPAL